MSKIIKSVLTGALVVCGLPGSATAQFEKKLLPKDSTALHETAIVADTGRMIPGHQNLKPYDTPGYCLSLVKPVEEFIWRSGERDTLSFGAQDTVLTPVTEKARECISKLTPSAVADYELFNYLTVASVLKDTALMRQVLNEIVGSDTIPSRYKILFLTDAGMLAAGINEPELSPFLWSILQEVKEYGPEAATQVATLYDVIKNNQLTRFDTSGFFATIAEKNAYLTQFTEDQVPDRASLIEGIYRDSLFLVWFKRPGNFAEEVKRFTYLATESRADHPLTIFERGKSELMPTFIGKLPAEMDLVAAFPSTASAVPKKGKVTVYYRLNQVANRNNKLTPALAKFLRLQQKYGSDKVEFVLVTTIEGYMWDSPPLKADVEAKLQDWYYRQYHELPFTILVNNRNFSKRRDGRIIRDRIPFDNFYGGSIRNIGYIVGKDGLIQALDQFMGAEAVVEKYIERELAR